MAFEPSVADASVGQISDEHSHASETPPAPKPRQKYRLRFCKSGDLRLVSHIDLMHCFERMLRRAALPFAFTQGFHPKPKMVFAQALALGVAAHREVVELELEFEKDAEKLDAEEVVARLHRHAPPGIVFLQGREVERRAGAQVRRAFYRVALPCPVPELPARVEALAAQTQCFAVRSRPDGRRTDRRRFDLKPYVSEILATETELTMALWITPYGAARPEEIVRALGLGEALDAGAIIERTDLEIVDEQPEGERWIPEIPRLADNVARSLRESRSAPSESETLAEEDDDAADGPRPKAGMPHALIPNPLSFET